MKQGFHAISEGQWHHNLGLPLESTSYVVNEQKPAGNHSATVDASGLASGVYFYTIKAGDFTASKKMTLVK